MRRCSCSLELAGTRIFETGGDRYEPEREQCDDCNSVLPIAPDVVVAYEHNIDTNAAYATAASRSSRSPALSWVADAVVRAACLDRSSADAAVPAAAAPSVLPTSWFQAD